MAAGRRTTNLMLAALAAGLILAAPIEARLRAPAPVSPANGAAVDALPAFAWAPISGADRYEFQLAADVGFNSPVFGKGKDRFFTRNARATVLKTVPNGTYWWRVRAATKAGATSPWSAPRSLRKSWTAAAVLQSPAHGAAVVYPETPLRLTWTPVPRAAKYLVAIGTDPALGSLVADGPGAAGAVETQATSFTRAAALGPGVYYWRVTPVDAQGNHGSPSSVASFTWAWPSATTPKIADLSPALEVFDPQFSWDPVPGAATYEVEVSSSQDFAPGSKVCCTQPTIATSLSPTSVLKDNTFYWRVRALDVDGNAGIWNVGPSFTKAFDKVPPVTAPSIKGLHMRDNLADPAADASGAAGLQTNVPLVTWDPVPGASSYEVEVTPFDTGLGYCNWSAPTSHWQIITATTAWTPLGYGLAGTPPFGTPSDVARDYANLALDQRYCVRVRARSNRDSTNSEVYGAYTELTNGDGTGWAFQWTGYPTGGSCTPSCNSGYLGSGDYVLPAAGTTVGRMPLFTWRPLAGKGSYFVIVARDPSFSNLVDYAFTQVPAYAPRTAMSPTTYPDETTTYYWAVLPAADANGTGAVGDPLAASPSPFEKRSTPPSLLSPASGTDISTQPVFRWTLTEAARRYRLQVAQDPSFGNPIDNVVTDSTSLSSNTTYPADTVLYWRVRADDEKLVGLTWSATGTFQKRLPAPRPNPGNPTTGDLVPTWGWEPIVGAVSYDVSVDLPDGTHKDIAGLRTAALTPILIWGTGLFHWKVRANFPKAGSGVVPGPYSGRLPFTRTISEPTGARAEFSRRHMLFSWEPKPGAKSYRLQISTRSDFAANVEDITTDNTSYAPLLTHLSYLAGDPLFWRVAAVDGGRNVGDFSAAQRVAQARALRLTARGKPKRGQVVRITIFAANAAGRPLQGVTVKLSGAGIRPRAKRTNKQGTATFPLRASRRGALLVRATKAGFVQGKLTLRVR